MKNQPEKGCQQNDLEMKYGICMPGSRMRALPTDSAFQIWKMKKYTEKSCKYSGSYLFCMMDNCCCEYFTVLLGGPALKLT